jgi:hypothetical protein
METMTPKEKALRLMGKFEDALTLQDCAKITVDEIVKEIQCNAFDFGAEVPVSVYTYCKNVKEEIKKL